MSSVLAICGDAGGASALAPVLRYCPTRRCRVDALASRSAGAVFARHAIAHASISETLGEAEALSVLRQRRPAVLLTGGVTRGAPRGESEPEKIFIAAARQAGVPSVALVDFWTDYRERFADHQGDLRFLPDRIAVLDERMREEMILVGIPEELIEVTGAPHLDRLHTLRAEFSREERANLRASVGVARGQRLVLFAADPGDPDGTEQDVVRRLALALGEIAARRHHKITLVIRTHAPESRGKYADLHVPNLHTVTTTENCGRKWALAADVVCGSTSTLLIEACYLGAIVLSLQPNPGAPDILPTNRSGLSVPVYDPAQIRPTVERALLDGRFRAERRVRLAAEPVPGDATRRVFEIITELKNRNPHAAQRQRTAA